ncbi:hypothetical protein QJR26_07185 [Clostridium baratii]
MKTTFLKIISVFTLISLFIQINVFASNVDYQNTDIIAYVDGIGLTKNDINSDGSIKSSQLDNYFFNKIMPRAVIAGTGSGGTNNTLPYGKSSALIQKRLSAPRFSQQTDDYYMTVSQAKDAAYTLNSTTVAKTIGSKIISNVIGSVAPYVSKPFSYITMFSSLPRISAATKITNLTRQNKKVRLRIIKNSNGTFYSVSEWNGKTLDLKLTNNKVAKEVIFNKKFK